MSDYINIKDFMADDGFGVPRTLFSEIKGNGEIVALGLASLFTGSIDDPDSRTDQCDQILITGYGNRIIHEPYLALSTEAVAGMIAFDLAETWAEYVQERVIVEAGLKDTDITTETLTRTEARDLSRTDTSQVSAFNSSTMVDDGANVVASDDDLEIAGTKTVTREKISVADAISLLNTRAKKSILSRIIQDTAQYLSLNIYS